MATKRRTKETHPLLCRKCGVRLSDGWEAEVHRLCPRHMREARANCPPFACSAEDIDDGSDPNCPECCHPWVKHGPRGCTQPTARFVTSYGEIVEDTGPFVCGCSAGEASIAIRSDERGNP